MEWPNCFCKWTFESENDVWITGCGNAFQFMDGAVKENHFKYCPYCGGRIETIEDSFEQEAVK